MSRVWSVLVVVALLSTVFPGAAPAPEPVSQGDPWNPERPDTLGAEAPRDLQRSAVEAYGNVPLHFEPNLGQFHPDVAFRARATGYTFFLTAAEAVFVVNVPGKPADAAPPTADPGPEGLVGGSREPARDASQALHVVRVGFVDAQPDPRVTGEGERPGKSNYFLGDDPAKWATDVPHHARVLVEDLWPGIHMVFYGTPERAVQYDFLVEPGADPAQIRLAFEGATPALETDGALLLASDDAPLLRFPAPYAYQDAAGDLVEVESGFDLRGDGVVGFRVGDYDREERLVIDPVVAPAYSTYLGGGALDSGEGIAVDAAGSAHITGETASTDFPTPGARQPANAGSLDAFVAKFTPAGDLAYSTYLGGSSDDRARGIGVDGNGNAYIAGWTLSTNFPTLNAHQPANAGSRDAFVAKLNPAGALAYGTYLGGSDNWDFGLGIAVDAGGSACVTGFTWSTDFPTLNAFQPAKGGGATDAFVAKFTPAGALAYSTYLGGSGSEQGQGIAVDAAGNAYVTGEAPSTDFPTLNAYQPANAGGGDAFVTKLTPGGALAYSTYLGGSSDDHGRGVAVDAAGNAYVTGQTESADFPALNAYQPANAGGWDGFVAKLTPPGNALAYSTHLGGSGSDWPQEVAVGAGGNAYLTGITRSTNFPTTLGAFQDTHPGGLEAAFATKLNGADGNIAYSTYLGGSSNDHGYGVAVDAGANAHITGRTWSTDFPTTPLAHQPASAGGPDAFVTKLIAQDSSPPIFSEDFDDGIAQGWRMAGLWHVSTCRSWSPARSLAYNDPSAPCSAPPDYDVGTTTSGSASTPGILLPPASPVTLSWKSWHETEAGTQYDTKNVQISTDGGQTWSTIWPAEDGLQRTWNDRSVDLAPYAGQLVHIRWLFNSEDAILNAFEGWYVDDVTIR